MGLPFPYLSGLSLCSRFAVAASQSGYLIDASPAPPVHSPHEWGSRLLCMYAEVDAIKAQERR